VTRAFTAGPVPPYPTSDGRNLRGRIQGQVLEQAAGTRAPGPPSGSVPRGAAVTTVHGASFLPSRRLQRGQCSVRVRAQVQRVRDGQHVDVRDVGDPLAVTTWRMTRFRENYVRTDVQPGQLALARLPREHSRTQAVTEDSAATIPNERRGVIADDGEGDHRQPCCTEHGEHLPLLCANAQARRRR